MRSCPHCQFLVPDGADLCGVCRRPVAVPEQPTGPWGPTVAPPVPVTPAAPGPGSRTGLVVAAVVVGALALVGLLGLGALFFLGETVERQVADSPAPDRWSTHVDPAGRFSVDLPGAPAVTEDELEAGLEEPVRVTVVEVARPGWDTWVTAMEIPDGAVGFSVPPEALRDGMLDGMEAEPLATDVVVTESSTVSTDTGMVLDTSVTLELSGVASVGFIRIVPVADDLFAVVTIGPAEQDLETRDLHTRLVDSFRAPALPG